MVEAVTGHDFVDALEIAEVKTVDDRPLQPNYPNYDYLVS